MSPTRRPPSASGPVAYEVRRLSTLLEASQALSGTLDVRAAVQRVLEILARHHGAVRGTVVLEDEEGEGFRVDAAGGTTSRTRPQDDDPVTKQVRHSGRPVIVPRVSREPLLHARAGDKPVAPEHDRSYLCVPIVLSRRTIGVVGVELRYKADREYDRYATFLGVVASLISQAVKVHRLVDAERRRLLDENIHLRQELRERYDFSNIISSSGPMRQVFEQIERVARANTTVLVRGESGTGKELVASAIHYNSLRAKKPFVKVSCAALPETLLEAELFGHEKGAFTGAHARKPGRFELADAGTLFLDEIGDLSPSTQVKLLRVLQEREFERLGGTETIKVNVRVIAATHRNLEQLITDGRFREDLLYRLNVFTIFVPPLRERKADLLLLADHYLERFCRVHGKRILRISTPAIDMLTSYHWPGNVRELVNCMERAVLVCDGNTVHAHHLPPTLQTAEASGSAPSLSLQEAVAAYEKDLIQDALKSARGNRARAARLLQTTPRILNYQVKRYGLDWRRFKG